MNNGKKLIIVTAFLIVLIGAMYLSTVSKYKKTVSSFKFSTVDLSKVPDGEYLGVCDVNLIKAEVRVKVDNHRITKIDILQHKNGKGTPAEAIVEEIINKQSLEVDTVSGATNSSKVILKAIDTALRSY